MKNFKKVISTVIALAISASSLVAVSASKFSDVADTASYAEAIEVLSALGIVNGYNEDGVVTFKPEGEITRAEAATMIVGALNMTEDAKNSAGTSQFADVNEKASWAAGYVNVGVSEGFISGMSETEFAPQENVTYAQMCVMLTKITGYADYAASSQKAGDPWYKCYTDMAASIGLNKGASVPLTSALTRGTVAQMIYNAITTPVLGVTEYAFDGNKYAPMDDADNFKTVLSDKFDGYVLTVKIDETAKSNSGFDFDEATFKAVKADFWDGYVKEDITKYIPNKVFPVTLVDVDVSDYLNQTGKAVVIINEYDENEMIYFKADSRLEKKFVSADDYVRQADRTTDYASLAAGSKSIRFGLTDVKVDDAVELFVNGTKYTGAINNDSLDKFLGNAQGDITLVKSSNTVSKYDSIFVNYYAIGKVTSVSYKNEKTSVRVTPIADGTPAMTGAVIIEVDDEAIEESESVVTVKKNGADVELKDLVKDDIIAFSTDFNGQFKASPTFANPKFLDVLATDETVKGMVVDYDDEAGTFTVGETDYKYVGFDYSNPTSQLEITHTYVLVLDPFGRLAGEEKVGTTDKFAILEKWASGRVTLLLADGSRATYDFVTATGALNETDLYNMVNDPSNPKTKANIQDRVVKYRVSGDEVKLYAVPASTKVALSNAKYNPSLGKVGSVKIEDGVDFINAKAYTGNITDYAQFDTSEFVAQTAYNGYAFKVSATDTFYSFVIFTDIGVTFTEESRFAVLLENVTSKMTPDGEPVYGAKALYNGEEVTLYWENAAAFVQGDAIFFTLDSDGLVNRNYKIYNKNGTNSIMAFKNALTADADYDSSDWAWNDFNQSAADIRLVAGYVTDVASNAITFGVADSNGDINFANVEVDIAGDMSGLFTYGIADECQAYEYNSGASGRESTKYALTDGAAIMESNLVEGATDVYSVTDPNSLVTEAVALVVNGDVVCIYAIY